MKKTIILALVCASILSFGCASLRQTPEEKARIAEQVQENLDNRTFAIDITQVNPQKGSPKHVTNYSVRVNGDILDSNLPYFGSAWSLPYGGGKGLHFEAPITDYIETFPKPDRRQILLSTDNGEDVLVYSITVFTDGSATVIVRSRNRDQISYYGNIVTE
ncbi:MAG: DUF4251 domain-containing protein [Bacteroidales bacterium]|nr:DUF4251 domain-containing protein [Bacteroidales bacterium]